MRIKHTLLLSALCLSTLASGQAAKLKSGTPFTRVPKNTTGDVYAVMAGVLAPDGEALLYVEDNLVPKVVRVDPAMNLAEELVLQNQPFDGLSWTGVAPFVADGTLYCLLASNTKKTTEYAIGQAGADGRPALNTLRRVASSEILYKNDPTTTLPYRPQPDPILFSQGLLFANTERIIVAPDGKHYLLNNHTVDMKGNKRFWFAYLDKEFTQLGVDVPGLVAHFGNRIAFAHLRNIQGTPVDFLESFPDIGNLDMAALIRAFARNGVNAYARPDHSPLLATDHAAEEGYGFQGHLFTLGYVRGIMDAV